MGNDFTPEPVYAGIVERIIAMRKAAGLSQNELADASGFARSTINAIEAGRQRVALHVLIELAKLFGCSLGELLPGQEMVRHGVGVEAIHQSYAKQLERHLELWEAMSRSFDALIDLHVQYVKATREK